MDSPRVEIVSDGATGRNTTVTIDGVEQRNLTGIRLAIGVHDVNRLELEHVAVVARWSGRAEVDHVRHVELLGSDGPTGSGSGPTYAAALRDLADQLEASLERAMELVRTR